MTERPVGFLPPLRYPRPHDSATNGGPVYLDEIPKDENPVPLGLRALHAIRLRDLGHMGRIADAHRVADQARIRRLDATESSESSQTVERSQGIAPFSRDELKNI